MNKYITTLLSLTFPVIKIAQVIIPYSKFRSVYLVPLGFLLRITKGANSYSVNKLNKHAE